MTEKNLPELIKNSILRFVIIDANDNFDILLRRFVNDDDI